MLEERAQGEPSYPFVRMNYNRNYVRELPYYPFTPILLMAKDKAAFMFMSGSMNEFWLTPFIENTRRLSIISPAFLEKLHSLERL